MCGIIFAGAILQTSYVFANETTMAYQIRKVLGSIPGECNYLLNNKSIHFENPYGLSVPEVRFAGNHTAQSENNLIQTEVIGKKSRLEEQLNIIRFATKSMERRNWSDDFLSSREEIAKEFFDRSIYIKVEEVPRGDASHGLTWRHDFVQEEKKLRGTLGLTYATSQKNVFGGMTNEKLLSRIDLLLGMEKTLQKPVIRYFDSQGRSIIVELRTFAKDSASVELVRDVLISDGIAMTFAVIKNYPELYDQPIIYTYGDELSRRFYGKLGFKVQEHLTPLNSPIHTDAVDAKTGKLVNWWVLAITPKDLEKNLLLLGQEHSVEWTN